MITKKQTDKLTIELEKQEVEALVSAVRTMTEFVGWAKWDVLFNYRENDPDYDFLIPLNELGDKLEEECLVRPG